MKNSAHPMELQEYAINTPSINRFFETIKNWLYHKVTGAYFYGTSRMGKSRAIKFWVSYLIREEGIKCAVFRVIYSRSTLPSWTHFYDELLSSIDMGGSSLSGNKAAKRKKLIRRLSMLAKIAGGNQILMIIDEAQNLNAFDYKCFCDLQSRLDEIGFRVTFVYVGSFELKSQHDTFMEIDDKQVIGRFSMHNAKFSGIKTSKELEFVLKGYDENSEWPDGSGTSYTKYYFTKAFNAGFRMSDLSGDFWGILVELTPQAMQDKIEIPMEHIAKSVEYLFRLHSDVNKINIEINKKQIEEAINSTKYSVFIRGLPVG